MTVAELTEETAFVHAHDTDRLVIALESEGTLVYRSIKSVRQEDGRLVLSMEVA